MKTKMKNKYVLPILLIGTVGLQEIGRAHV